VLGHQASSWLSGLPGRIAQSTILRFATRSSSRNTSVVAEVALCQQREPAYLEREPAYLKSDGLNGWADDMRGVWARGQLQ